MTAFLHPEVASKGMKSVRAEVTGVCLCRFVKFQRVNVLSIFVEDNQGDEDTTIIQKIVLTGSGGETFNVNEIKKVEHE